MNPLIRDEDVSFLLYDVLDVESLTKLPYFAEHGRETFDPYLANVARFALEELTMTLGAKGMGGDVEGMLAHSVDYLTLASIVVVAWQHLDMACAVRGRDDAFARGKRLSAEYWIRTEIPRAVQLAELCASGEDSFLRVRPEEL